MSRADAVWVVTQNGPVPIGQPRSGAGLETASAASATSGGSESYDGGSSTVNARSPVTVAAWARPPGQVMTAAPESRAIQLASTSRAVTGEPSQNRASSRSVNVQRRPASSTLHELASPGTIRPSQSTPTRVWYSCRNTSRSASLWGTGAWDGSMGSVSAMVTVSRVVAAPVDRVHTAARADAAG